MKICWHYLGYLTVDSSGPRRPRGRTSGVVVSRFCFKTMRCRKNKDVVKKSSLSIFPFCMVRLFEPVHMVLNPLVSHSSVLQPALCQKFFLVSSLPKASLTFRLSAADLVSLSLLAAGVNHSVGSMSILPAMIPSHQAHVGALTPFGQCHPAQLLQSGLIVVGPQP